MKGLGDLIAVITKYSGIKFVVDKIFSILGRDCGCQARQDYLNKVVPFTKETFEDITQEEQDKLNELFNGD